MAEEACGGEGDHIRRYYLHDNGNQELHHKNKLYEFDDPVNETARSVWLMTRVAWGLAQVDPASLPAAAQTSSGAIQRTTCGYCGTLYLLGQTPTCPNCGAPPRG